MEKILLNALERMTYGIYVLTTFYKDEINGMIASWVSQVSYDPPLIMVAVHPNRYSHHLIYQSHFFAMHVLDRNQTDLLERFKGPDPVGKFKSIKWSKGKTGSPILEDCVAYFECEVKESYSPGNHTVFIGEVKNADIISEKEILCSFHLKGVYIGKD